MSQQSNAAERPPELALFAQLKRKASEIDSAIKQLRPRVLELLHFGDDPDLEIRVSSGKKSFLDDVAVKLLDSFLESKKITKEQYESCFVRAVSQTGIKKLIADGILSAGEMSATVKVGEPTESIWLKGASN